MTFTELLAEVPKLKCEEQRAQAADYLEVVVAPETLVSLHKILATYFGLPLKPEGHSPSGEARRYAEPYGGIRKDQTMYFRQDGDFSQCALLWPWGSGTRVTVKIIQSKGAGPAGGGKGFLAGLFGRK